MAKAGWKKAQQINSVDAGLAALKSTSSEVRHIHKPDFDSEKNDLPQRRKNQLDPLTEMLGCKGYFAMMRWQWFKYDFGGVKYSLEVSRFYEDKNLAIDIAPRDNETISKAKKELLTAKGIKYIVLKSAMGSDLKEVLNEL